MIDLQAELALTLSEMQRQIEELQRAVGRPVTALQLNSLTVNGLNLLGAASAGLLIQAGRTAATTNASGEITVTFPTAFSSTPGSVVGQRGAASTTDATVVRHTTSASSVVFICRNAGALVVSGAVTVDWIAVGAA